MTEHYVYCIARGRRGQWEAFCLDFDLAVQGRSFEEVMEQLKQAIVGYVDAAMNESPDVRKALLNRRVPLMTRVLWRLRLAMWALLNGGRRDNDETTAAFPVTCPA